MGQGKLRLIQAIPGPANDAAILAEFCARGDGLATALDSRHLAALRYAVPTESEVELLEFGRMVAKFARLADAEPRPLAGTAHLTGAVAEACEKLEADSPLFGSRGFGGLHRRLAETIKELAAWGFEHESLSLLAQECSKDLAPKLASIAQVWAQAEDRLESFGSELSHRHVARCLQSDPDSDVAFPRCLIFLDGEFAPKHAQWLKWAASTQTEVTVVVEGSPATVDLFEYARDVRRLLETDAEMAGAASEFSNALFAGTVATSPGIEVDSFIAADPLSEVEWALRRCLEAGESRQFHQCGIFARNLDDYGPLIESAALRLGVPIRISRRVPLRTNGYLKVLSRLAAALGSDDVRELGGVLGSSYFLAPNAARRPILDELSSAYRQRDSQWSQLESWSAAQGEGMQWLTDLLGWRAVASGTATLRVWRDRLTDLGNLLPAIGRGVVQERDIRAKNSFERALGVRASFLEGQALTLAQVCHEVESILDNETYTLPSAPYGVQVSDSPLGFGPVGHLFVLGMLEGVFPRRRSESPILTDADRREISDRRALTLPLEDSFGQARRERDAFVSLCAIPSQGLTFSYPEATDERDNISAFYLEEAKRALGVAMPQTNYPRAWVAPPAEACMAEADRALRSALDLGPDAAPMDVEIRDETRAELASRLPEALTPRQLRTAFECPFRHFAQEILRLYPDRDSRRWYQLRSLPQSAQLSRQPSREQAESTLRNLLDAELEQMRPHTSEADWLLMRQGGERLIRDWVDREFRSREIWTKDAGSEMAPIVFGSPTLRDELPRAGKIAGSVAGTSRMGPYKVVHLVESNTPGQERGAPFGLKDRDMLYYGIHLMAGFEKGAPMALEVESMSGGRKLMLLPRADEPVLVGDRERGLEVVDLAGGADESATHVVFFERVKELIGQAAKVIREVDVRANPGEVCSFCDHGELCRQSAEFGESDSPFEGDDE